MKRWIHFIFSNSLLVLLLTFSVLLLTVFLVRTLNVEAFPDPAPPLIEIVTLFEGRSAEEAERQITIPIEIGLAGMPGMESINSTSLYGLSDIKCKFSYDTPYKDARQQVINRLANIPLPNNIQPSVVPNPMGEVMRYALVGSNNPMELRTMQDWIVARILKTADGVEDIVSWGGYIKTYSVIISPENLIKYQIPFSQVIDALSKSNVNVGARILELGDQSYAIRGMGLIQSLSDIENVVVAYKNNTPILIKNLGVVRIGNSPRTGIAGLNKNDTIVMGVVVLRKDAKNIPSIQSVHAKIDELNSRVLPKGIKIQPIYDQWGMITYIIKSVAERAIIGILLVGIVIFIFLGNLYGAIITALIIPISLLITLSLMAFLGESANIVSISAIDFGIIVHPALVVIESFSRLSKKNQPVKITLIEATIEISKSILFTMLVIFIAFIPIFTMKGAEKLIFSPMAKTYLYALSFTLILTFTYLLAAILYFLKNTKVKETNFVAWIRTKYGNIVKYLLTKSRYVLIAASLIVLLGISYSGSIIGTQFLPEMDEGNFELRILFPQSISLAKTYEYAKKARDFIMSFSEVATVEFQVGRPEDGSDPTGPFNSEYFIDLKPYSKWKSGLDKEELEDQIRQGLEKLFPNADINVSQYIQDNIEEVMSGVKGENVVKIFGDNLAELERLAKDTKERISKIKGIEDVGILRELGQPNFLIEVDRGSASAFGLNVEDILDTISAAIGGKSVTQVIEGAKSFDLVVSFPPSYRENPENITSVPLILPNGNNIPLSRIAHLGYDTGASFIFREKFQRFIPIKFSVTSNDLGGTVAKAQKAVTDIKLPEGYYMEWSGIFNEMEKSFKNLSVSTLISLFLIFAVLYASYQSLRNVLVVMAPPVLAIFGGLLSLLITNQTLNDSSIVGFISLIGISVLNGSIFVNHYISLIRSGKTIEEAISETARDEFRPIFMIGLMASLGLLPAALAQGIGSQVAKPLAVVVVGGTIVGTLFCLILLPILAKYIDVSKYSKTPKADIS